MGVEGVQHARGTGGGRVCAACTAARVGVQHAAWVDVGGGLAPGTLKWGA